MSVAAGQRNIKGSLYRRKEVSSDSGHHLEDEWIADAWVKVHSVTGNEKWQASSQYSEITHELTVPGMRLRIEENWFFKFKDAFGSDRVLEVKSSMDNSHQMNSEILIRCIEVTSG